ncbi:hypothetical protein MTO96_009561 [Rhipicephalus appendiculatus]
MLNRNPLAPLRRSTSFNLISVPVEREQESKQKQILPLKTDAAEAVERQALRDNVKMVTGLQSALWEQAANTSFKQHRRRCSQQFKRRAWFRHRSVAQSLGAAVIRDVARLSNAESLLLTSGLLESRGSRQPVTSRP